MKKILLAIILILCLALCSCGPVMQTHEQVSGNSDEMHSMFILLEKNDGIGYLIVYHKDTKVMYAISCGYYNKGTFTVMLNPDGTPMIYGERRGNEQRKAD